MMKIDTNILVAEKVFNDPNENDSASWLDALEWKRSMLGDFSGQIRRILAQHFTTMDDLKNNCTILDVDISDESGENLLDVKEVKQNFKNRLTEEHVAIVNGESLGKLGHIASYLTTFKCGIDCLYESNRCRENDR